MQSRRSFGAVAGCLALTTILSACGVSTQVHDQDIATLRGEFQADSARRDTMAAAVLTAAIIVNSDQNDRLMALEARMAAMDIKMAEIEELAVGAIRYNAPVHFGWDSHELMDGSRVLLDRFAVVVNRFYPDALITVEGFADPAGDAEYNQWLGQQRAEAVMTYLVEVGVDAGQLRAVSYGDANNRQVEPGAWGDNGKANRRVAFVIDYREGM